MRAEIELYKGLRLAYFGSLSISMLLTEALRGKAADDALSQNSLAGIRRTKILLHFHDPGYLESAGEPQPISELSDSLGWVHVQFKVGGS